MYVKGRMFTAVGIKKIVPLQIRKKREMESGQQKAKNFPYGAARCLGVMP